jgi:hypothetical protein
VTSPFDETILGEFGCLARPIDVPSCAASSDTRGAQDGIELVATSGFKIAPGAFNA